MLNSPSINNGDGNDYDVWPIIFALVYSTADGHLGSFQSEAITNTWLWTFLFLSSGRHMHLLLLSIYLEEELGHWVVVCSFLIDSAK